MILPIVTEPNPILRRLALPINEELFGSEKLKKLADNLAETMRAKDGVGMAAPQIDESLRLCVIAKAGANGADLFLVNPEWEKISRGRDWGEEGCLSVPDVFGQVQRWKKIRLKARGLDGEWLELVLEKFPARVVQHEVDHLDGILFIDKSKDIRRTDKI